MESKDVLLALCIIFAACFAVTATAFYLFWFRTQDKRRKLLVDSIFLYAGKVEPINYKKIVEYVGVLTKNHANEQKISEFRSLLAVRVKSDVSKTKNFSELKKYMKDYDKLVCPTLLFVHEIVTKECNTHVGLLFSDEISRCLSLESKSMKVAAFRSLVGELELPEFHGFAYQRGSVNKAKNLLKQIEASDEGSKLIDIQKKTGT